MNGDSDDKTIEIFVFISCTSQRTMCQRELPTLFLVLNGFFECMFLFAKSCLDLFCFANVGRSVRMRCISIWIAYNSPHFLLLHTVSVNVVACVGPPFFSQFLCFQFRQVVFFVFLRLFSV